MHDPNAAATPSAFRVAVVNSHPIQYFAPLYAFLNQDPRLEITALYCSDDKGGATLDPGFERTVAWDVDLLSGYRSVFLGSSASGRSRGRWSSSLYPQLWSEIRHGDYDAVWLHGYAHAADVVALCAAKTRGVPVFMRSETHLGLHKKKWKRWLRDAVLALAYHFVDAFLSIGSANKRYYRSLGIPNRRIFDVPYTVDNERFMAGAAVRPTERADLRRKYRLPIDDVVVLYASKLLRRKRPDDLCRAVARLRDRGHDVTLFIVGTGEMELELRELTQSLALRSVVFGGFINQAELPRVYAAVDIFVLPSEDEPWGLVVNEVMCAGKPVVVSDEVGCVPDLVADGVNGYHVKARDVDSLVVALERLVADDRQRQRMGLASLSIMRTWSYEQCRVGLTEALALCAAAS